AAAAAGAAAAGARSAASSGFGSMTAPVGRERAQMSSWVSEPEILSAATPAATLQRKLLQQHHQHQHHSSSVDNAAGGGGGGSASFFAKFDVFASKVSSAFEPLKLQRPFAAGGGGGGSGHQQQQQGLPPSGPASPWAAVVAAGEQQAATGSPASRAPSQSPPPPPPPQHHHPFFPGQSPPHPQPDLAAAAAATPTGEGGSPCPSAAAALHLPLPGELCWLRDWRVRLALSSPAHCADLALQLALAAASCYSRAGRQRSAAQLYGDVGAVLLGRGQAEVVSELMEHVASLAQAEGWYALLGRALPVMMAAQQAIGHVMLPYTCVRYLSLPPLACHADVRHRVMEQVLSSAGCPLNPDGGGGGGRPRRPPLPSAVLQLSTGQAVQAALLPGWTSKFYGTRSASGLPSLVPPAR
ncbi:hypothetical protein PLESTM_001176700, partial [Pleodorina starrii]